jgi:thioredoxin 1
LIASSRAVSRDPALAGQGEAHRASQQAGEVVLIDVWASWCGTCARQQEVLAEYRIANPDKPFHILEVDFDKDKKWVRHFRAPRQSTLLLYSGEHQFWYSVAETRPEVIAAELDKAIAAAASARGGE